MATQVIKPTPAQRFDIRCDVGDAIVANLALHFVFFFERRLDTRALAAAFGQALTTLPIFAGRLGLIHGAMGIRCHGQGVPFTCVSSERTIRDATCSTSADAGHWLVDPVNGVTARWGAGPICKVRVTHLAEDATAIGVSWHHAVGDMQTLMHLMNAWAAAAAGAPIVEPVIATDRAGYLEEHLPTGGAHEPGVRFLGLGELARGAVYLARGARRQRTLTLHFGTDEIERMRDAYADGAWLSANDVVCGHVSEALMHADPVVDRRTLAVAVNARSRYGLDPMLVGNVITTLNIGLRRGEAAGAIAERIRHAVNHFGEHCDMRVNQRLLSAAGKWRAARCVSTAFDPARWNPLISNLSGFGVYRLRFEGTTPCYFTTVLKLPVAGLGALLDGPGGHGLVLQMALPPREFDVMSGPAMQELLHRFRRADPA